MNTQRSNLDYADEPNRSNIYDKARVLDFDKHIKKQERFRYTKLHWEQIPRANNPKKPLSPKAVNLLAVIVHKLRKSEVVVLNQNYLSRITDCERDQNINLLSQISDVLDISFHVKTTITGKINRNSYVIKHTEKGQAIIESAEVLLTQKHFVGKVAVTRIEKPATDDQKDRARCEFIRTSYIYKEKVFENNRSNESTFLENSNSLILPSETSNLVETKKELLAEEVANQATIHPLKPNTAQQSCKPANQRKKLTNAGYKAKRGKLLHFRQYDEPKSLADHYPLSDEDVSLLQSKSGREFGLNAQNQILQDMSNKPKLLGHTFPSKASFIAYMSKALASEKRNAVQINNTDFKIKANLTQEQLVEYTALAQREAYLSEVEDRAITYRSDETQFKAKLVGTLGERSYDILPHLVRIEKKDEVFELHLNRTLELTKQTKDAILKEAKAVDGYRGVERLEFVSSEKETYVKKWSMADTATAISNNIQPKPLELPQGLWGQVSKELISEYGIDIYRNWFKKLTATVDENMKTIELKASSEFVKDWIVDKYENQLRKITNNLNIEFLGVSI